MREYQEFLSKVFCVTVPKKFVGKPFCDVFQRNSGSETLYGKEGGGSIKIFCRKFLSHSAEKIGKGTLLCCVSELFC